MKTIFYSLLIIISFSASANSQLNTEWVRSHNGAMNSNDEAFAHVTDDSGNVYATGRVINPGNSFDIYTVKYNNAGVLMWEKTFNGPGSGSDIGYSIDVDHNGNVYVAGETRVVVPNIDIILIKYSSIGEELWTRIYDGLAGSRETPSKVITDNAANIYVAGTTWENGTGFDFITLKFYSDGTQLWAKRYDAFNSNDMAADMILDGTGNAYVTGSSFNTGTQNDFLTVKYNSIGEELWARRYDGPWHANDNFTKIALDGLGNPVVAGSSVDSGSNSDYLIVKYDQAGTSLWTYRYATAHPSAIDEVKAITVDINNNIIVTGASAGGGSTSYDFLTVKVNSTGVFQWAKRYHGNNTNDFDEARSVTTDSYGNVFVAGLSEGANSLDDILIAKYDPAGNELSITRYNSPADRTDVANNISIDVFGNFIVSGIITGATTSADFSILKFSTLTNINNVSGTIPSEFSLSQNYPNPFNPATKISFALPNDRMTKVSVYDVTGKEIAVLINELKRAGNYDVIFNGANFASGVYFYRIQTGDFVQTKRMILLK